MGLLILTAKLIAAEIAFITAVCLLYRFLVLGVGLVLLIFVWQTLTVSFGPSLQCIAFVSLFTAGIARFVLRGKFTPVNLSWLFLGVLLFFSVLRGILIYDYKTVGLDFIPYFCFWAGTIYFMSFEYKTISSTKWSRLWLYAAITLVLIAIVRWTTDILGITNWATLVGVTQFRVLNAPQTFFLAEAFGVLLILTGLKRPPYWRILLPTLGIAILLLQHRTVWVTTVFLLMSTFLLERKLRSRFAIWSSLLGVAILSAILFFGERVSSVGDTLSKSYNSMFSSEGSTFTWRIEGWQSLLAKIDTPFEYLFGQPFGSGYERYISTNPEMITVSPHNYYVQTFLRVGGIGLVSLLLVYLFIFLSNKMLFSSNARIHVLQEKRTLWILSLMHLIYFIPYTPSYEQSMVLGFALSYMQARECQEDLTVRNKLNLKSELSEGKF